MRNADNILFIGVPTLPHRERPECGGDDLKGELYGVLLCGPNRGAKSHAPNEPADAIDAIV